MEAEVISVASQPDLMTSSAYAADRRLSFSGTVETFKVPISKLGHAALLRTAGVSICLITPWFNLVVAV